MKRINTMNHIKHICRGVLLSSTLVLCSINSFAAVWNKEKEGSFTLIDDISIGSVRSLTGNLTLTLPADATKDVVIKNTSKEKDYLFQTNGYRLTIKSESPTYKVILDGGAVWEEYTGETEHYLNAQLYSCFERAGAKNSGKTQKSLIFVTASGGLTLNNVILRNNQTTTNGAGILLGGNGKSVELDNIIITGCQVATSSGDTSASGSAIRCQDQATYKYPINIKNSEIYDCAVVAAGDSTYGTIRTGGTSNVSINITDCNIHHCFCWSGGSAIWYNASQSGAKLKMDNCDIHHNYSENNAPIEIRSNAEITACDIHHNGVLTGSGAGGIDIEPWSGASGDFKKTLLLDSQTEIHHNTSYSGGGGIKLYIAQRDATSLKMTLKLDGTKIYNNRTETNNGGGIYVTKYSGYTTSKKRFGELLINGAEIYGNEAANNGGGIYLSGYCETTIYGDAVLGKAGEGNANKAKLGGGLYAVGGTCTISDCTIENNIATGKNSDDAAGGAFYISGDNTVVTIQEGAVVRDNKATQGNGGAFYIGGGTTTISGGEIFKNKAASGAGLCINDCIKFEISGGSIYENIASVNGGGAYVSGGAVSFNGNIHNNKAENGAGLYLAGGAKMTFTGGIITANEAKNTDEEISNTAYWGRDKSLPVEGCGGGIYLENGVSKKDTTVLSFSFPPGEQTFGLYGNTASKAGQEIIAEGNYTRIKLPLISNMKLAGFEGQDANPNWYQDYFDEDDGYEYSHAVSGNVDHVYRYKKILSEYGNEVVQHLILDDKDFLNSIKNKYLCITLGFSMLDLTVRASGLLGGETALVKLTRYGSTGQKTYDVMLKKGENETTASKTLVNMPWGTYTIEPNNNWNWHYEPISPMTNIRIGDAATAVIDLEYKHKSVAEQPQHYDVHD